MKYKSIQLSLVIQLIFLLLSCDRSGNLALTSGYEYDVMVYQVYEYNNTFIETFNGFSPGISFYPAAMGHIECNYIVAIRIETLEGTVLAEYTPEYLELLRKAYKSEKEEAWTFNEKGLFIETIEVSRRYNFDFEKVAEYYRSDEAVENLRKLLESAAE
jgi:hypothetical protein